MSPLSIYRASAGSGKTFALTLEYLKLLFTRPGVHRHILAVTFTNKAAAEMKQRILTRLYLLSRDEGEGTVAELELIRRHTGLEDAEIKSRAGQLLSRILNDYSWFSVGTIDRFFQSVIRVFTREIGIQPGYNLELDTGRILSQASDRLFEGLLGDADLQKWLIRFAEERMEEARSWNFKGDMMELGQELFHESFQSIFLEHDFSVISKRNLEDFLKDLNKVQGQVNGEMADVGRKALDLIGKAGLEVNDFRLKANSPASLFLKASREELTVFTDAKLAALTDPGKWLNKSAPLHMEQLTQDRLMPLYQQLFGHYRIQLTIQAIRNHFHALGILSDLWDQVQSFVREQNLFLISDASRFLKGIIGGNQVPFIYERTGNRYRHIMLDEFQDTSVFQYENFTPLLDNSLAHGFENLVVGDVKQSIYRWRNSDWDILASRLASDFAHQKLEETPLLMNFRSSENIIRFNNSVFQLAQKVLGEVIEEELQLSSTASGEGCNMAGKFQNAYSDVVQEIPEERRGTGGLVRLEWLDEGQEADFREQSLERMRTWIDEILQSGIRAGEIAILVRTRREGVRVASYLLDHTGKGGKGKSYRLVSNESLLLIGNPAVSLIIAILRYLAHPDDELNNAHVKHLLLTVKGSVERPLDQLYDSRLPVDEVLPAELLKMLPVLRKLPLFDLVEHLISLLGLDSNPAYLPYLQALQDLVVELSRKSSPGVAEFIHYWEETGRRKAVNASEESNSIRILTIHKAKGLEFRAVLIPFCSWEITTGHQQSHILWCDTKGTPFDRIPVVPLRFNRELRHTLFSGAYYQERMKGYMDNLNLLYVAFTRAREILCIGAPREKREELRQMGGLLERIISMEPEKEPSLGSLKSFLNGRVLQVGAMPSADQAGRAGEGESFEFGEYPVSRAGKRVRLRISSHRLFAGEGIPSSTARWYGNTMHQVFSRIISEKDVDPELKRIMRKGLLSCDELPALRDRIRRLLENPRVRPWFTDLPGRKVYNERSILDGRGSTVRPDRVLVDGQKATVIDLKFGQREEESHRGQVIGYMEQLKAIGYNIVEGYLWYVELDRIRQIVQE